MHAASTIKNLFSSAAHSFNLHLLLPLLLLPPLSPLLSLSRALSRSRALSFSLSHPPLPTTTTPLSLTHTHIRMRMVVCSLCLALHPRLCAHLCAPVCARARRVCVWLCATRVCHVAARRSSSLRLTAATSTSTSMWMLIRSSSTSQRSGLGSRVCAQTRVCGLSDSRTACTALPRPWPCHDWPGRRLSTHAWRPSCVLHSWPRSARRRRTALITQRARERPRLPTECCCARVRPVVCCPRGPSCP